MSTAKASRHRRHDCVTGAAATDAVNRLGPTIEVVSEQPHTNRENRRHARTANGAVVNIPKAKQQQALNVPYRRPVS